MPDDKNVPEPERTLVRDDAQATLVRGSQPSALEDSLRTLSPDATPTVAGVSTPGGDEGPVTPEAPGRYEIKGEYGRGGQSRVLLAFDTHIGREIALKELLTEPAVDGTPRSASQSASSRFVREARITGLLEHPNIVPVYELGQHPDGIFYYTQKLVRGGTLKKSLQAAATLPDRLKLLSHFADLCHAVAYAHSRGVVHRDLKPENVMVGQFGETVVLDWGLAKARGQKDLRARDVEKEALLLRTRSDATVEGHALGTPSYMSPEQALGKLDEIDERSDVWSLGAILFEILTGRPPFDGDSAYSVIDKVIKEAPPRVRHLRRDAPPELAAVAERCLTRDKAARYASAEELALEIEQYQSGGNVRAYQYSSWELARKFIQKHKAATAISLAALLLLLGALVVIRDEAAQARAALAEARAHLSEALLEKAHAAERDFLWHKAEIFYAAARVQQDGPEARWGSVIEGADASGLTRIAGHSGWVLSVAFSPDGKSLASGGWDSSARIFDLDTGREEWRFQARSLIEKVAFSADGTLVATRDTDGVARLHDRKTGVVKSRTACPEGFGRASLGFVGNTLYAACPSGTLQLPAGGPALPGARRLAVCGDQVALLGKDEIILGAQKLSVPGAEGLACNGGVLAVDAGSALRLFSTPKLLPLRDLPVDAGPLAVSADGKLVAAGANRSLRLYDVATGAQLASLQRPVNVKAVAISPDAKTVAIAEEDGAVVLWTPSLEGGHGEAADAFAFLPGGGRVEAHGEHVLVRDAAGKPVADLQEVGLVTHGALSASGRIFASVVEGKSISLWDLQGGKLLRRLPTHSSNGVSFAGEQLVYGDEQRWKVAGGAAEPRAFDPPPGGHPGAVAGAPDGSAFYADTGEGRTVRVALPSGDRLFAPVPAFGFATNGKVLAVGSFARVALLDPRTLEPRGELDTEGAAPLSLAFSKDGALLAAAGLESAVTIYDLASGREVAHLPVASSGLLRGLAFSSGGELLRIGLQREKRSVTVRVGKPETLLDPAAQLQGVLQDHGVELKGADVQPRPPPIWANDSGRCAGSCPP